MQLMALRIIIIRIPQLTWIDDDNHSRVAGLPGLSHRPLQLLDVQAPLGLLVQVVVHLGHVEFGDGGRVQGVLWNGHHDATGLAVHLGVEQREQVLDGP